MPSVPQARHARRHRAPRTGIVGRAGGDEVAQRRVRTVHHDLARAIQRQIVGLHEAAPPADVILLALQESLRAQSVFEKNT